MKKQFTTIEVESFAGPFTMEGTVIGKYRHGFIYESGSWGLMDLKRDEWPCKPAWFLVFKKKGKRKPIAIGMHRILNGIDWLDIEEINISQEEA